MINIIKQYTKIVLALGASFALTIFVSGRGDMSPKIFLNENVSIIKGYAREWFPNAQQLQEEIMESTVQVTYAEENFQKKTLYYNNEYFEVYIDDSEITPERLRELYLYYKLVQRESQQNLQ